MYQSNNYSRNKTRMSVIIQLKGLGIPKALIKVSGIFL